MTDSEVLVTALADISRENKQGDFAVKRGSYSVNGYPGRSVSTNKKLPIDQTTQITFWDILPNLVKVYLKSTDKDPFLTNNMSAGLSNMKTRELGDIFTWYFKYSVFYKSDKSCD